MSTHSTKWNRMNVREHLLEAINYAKESMSLAKIKPTSKPAKGISSTAYPDGRVTYKK